MTDMNDQLFAHLKDDVPAQARLAWLVGEARRVPQLEAEVAQLKRAGAQARRDGYSQGLANAGDVRERLHEVRKLPQLILNTVDPVQPGPDVRAACVALIRAAVGPCCCHYGAAVAGEFPEFECAECPQHGGDAAGDYRCKRHKATGSC